MNNSFEILAAFAMCDFHKNTFFAISKMAKINFAPEKSLKLPEILFFFRSENCIFGSF